ncbi:hypothetical protein [Halorubellus salinus]|uniref:hypothetical protein n=1 Tax=Halorubellus salinus TaxID=755309 RepID=UPI001D0653AA|nr:hypothetical protein [Halorubellus salinus]
MRRRRALHALAATAVPAAFAGCLGGGAIGESNTDSSTWTTAATTTVSCDAPSSLELSDPEYDLEPSNETPPVSTSELPDRERQVVEAALPPEPYATCGDASALRSLADRIEDRHELRAERHVDRWTERNATVTPPAYLPRYYLEHDGRHYQVEAVVDGDVRLGGPG